jgi:hypothetical protein
MANQYEQIVNDGLLYINELNLSWLSNTTASLAAGQARDTTNVFDIILPSSVTLNIAVNGVNGLDTGTVAATTFYYVHLILDPTNRNPVGALISKSLTAPTLPAGYGYFKHVGNLATDGSSHIRLFYQHGNGVDRRYEYDAAISVVSAGAATSLTQINLSNYVPTKSVINVLASYAYTPAAASHTLSIVPTSTSSTTPAQQTGQVAAVVIDGEVSLMSQEVTGAPSIYYLVSSGSDAVTIYVKGYIDSM